MSLKVHLLHPPAPELLEEFRRQLSAAVQLTTGPNLPDPADYQILIADHPQRAHLEASPQLRALIIPYTGVPEETLTLMAEFRRIAVHNSHHPAGPTAEMAMALLLAAARFLVPADRALRAGDWTRGPVPKAVGLEGKTVLILGYGEIGQRVARVCHALGLQVLAVRRQVQAPRPLDVPVDIHPLADLAQLLPRAHVLMVTLPLTPETRGLIGAAELARLPRGALLVNVGRGPIVDEPALYTALRDGVLLAAGLDVWYHYPPDKTVRTHTPPATYPFHELDNVVMSPHRGGFTADSELHGLSQLADMLNAAARGEPLPNPVDVLAGY